MNTNVPVLVVFDLDDTLYLEVDFVRSGFAAVEAGLGIEGLAATAWTLHKSGKRGTVLTESLRWHGHEGTETEVARAVAIYRAHRPHIALAADATDALAALVENPSVRLALLTDGYAVTQRNKIEALGLARWIGPMMITDELAPNRAYWKPHPEAFRRLQGDARRPGECLYIADNPRKDFDAPARLGWRTVRLVRRGGLWEHEPDGAVRAETTLQELSSLAGCVHALVTSSHERCLPMSHPDSIETGNVPEVSS
jgi:putative hydrolase of the HAD superfamily